MVFIVLYMGTIVPNKEKTDAFIITRLYNQKNLGVAYKCACRKQLAREETSKMTGTRLNVT